MVGIEGKGGRELSPQTAETKEQEEIAEGGTEGGEGLNFKEEREVGSKGKERRVDVFLTGEEKKGTEKVEQLSAWEDEEEGEGKESQVYRVNIYN